MLAYLDHHATTPCDPAVVAAMAPWWSEHCANPANRLYRPALEAAAAVERARGQLARVLGSSAETVIFTSGATEANNLALKGVCEAALAAGNPRRRLVSLVSEHRAVLDPLAYLARHGFPVSLVPIQPNGLVDLTQLEAVLGDDVLLLSVMAANNEIGVLQPLAAIAALCRQRGVLLHVDAAQAAGHIPLAIEELGIDLLSLSGHKFYGPKGVGALLVRPGLQLAAQLHGGGQQDGRRAGTLPVPLVVGLGQALLGAEADREERDGRLGDLRNQLWEGLRDLGGIELNGGGLSGDGAPRLAHNLNVTVQGVDGTRLHRLLRQRLAVSSGSACSQGSPSHVLAALGRSRHQAAASIRFGLGRGSSDVEIALAIETVAAAVRELR
ncbi:MULTISPECIES: cysteine desulfurase family protein [unclassified Cyanobium]|uniref:cysteine desulfurase family protein n=1 Tax=unclassified Cyanobium TaxID=2627006 RepID=UPI0020CBD867|nr:MULTISPECIES: cysteine desulfurase family protein [unclassified Cyanobium]MCP9776747.1 cysteine desulfurase [Cyanobium sp. Tous-M-B4]MCP9877689.1 cysteine desulfurase [Cyanobium sp. A2C-AMD]